MRPPGRPAARRSVRPVGAPLRRALRSAACALLILAGPAAAPPTVALAARPAPAPTVILLRTPDDRGPWRAAENRTRDELRLMGLRVEEVRASPAEIDRLLDDLGADAVIRIERTAEGARAELWLPEPPAEPRRLELGALVRTGRDAAAVAALRTAELVHAGITTPVPSDSQPAPQPPAPEPPQTAGDPPRLPPEPPVTVPVPSTSPPPRLSEPPPAAPSPFTAQTPDPPDSTLPGEPDLPDDIRAAKTPPPRPSRLRGLGFHLGVLGGPGGAPPLVDLAVTVRVHLVRYLSFEPALSAAVAPTRASFAAGAVRLGLAAAQAAFVLTPGRPDARVTPRLAVGGGLTLAWARGEASQPLDARTDLAAIATLHAAAGLAIRLRPRLRLRLDVGAALLLPPIAVRIAGDEVARLGLPLLRGALGLEWQWPRR